MCFEVFIKAAVYHSARHRTRSQARHLKKIVVVIFKQSLHHDYRSAVHVLLYTTWTEHIFNGAVLPFL